MLPKSYFIITMLPIIGQSSKNPDSQVICLTFSYKESDPEVLNFLLVNRYFLFTKNPKDVALIQG